MSEAVFDPMERCKALENELVCVVKEKEMLNDAYAELEKKYKHIRDQTDEYYKMLESSIRNGDELVKKNKSLSETLDVYRHDYFSLSLKHQELTAENKRRIVENEKVTKEYEKLEQELNDVYAELDEHIYKKNDYEHQCEEYKKYVKTLEDQIKKLSDGSDGLSHKLTRLRHSHEDILEENAKLKAIVKAVETIFGGKILEDC